MVEEQRASDAGELRAARHWQQSIDDLRLQLANAAARAALAEAGAHQARQDLEADPAPDRAATACIRKDKEASLAACATAVQKECDLLANRVLNLQAQLVAEASRHRARTGRAGQVRIGRCIAPAQRCPPPPGM